MGTFDEFMTEVPLSLVAVIGAVMACMIVAAPQRHRLVVSLALLGLFLTIGQLRDFGDVAAAAKILSTPILLLVAISAHINPGPKRGIPITSCLCFIGGLICLFCVSSAIDWRKAVALRSQWILMSTVALWVARTIVDAATFRRVLWGLFIGAAAGTVVALSALVVDPYGAFASGHGRLFPYGCNPVQIGVLFALTAPLGLYLGVASKGSLRGICLALAILGTAGAVLTVSRMAVGVIAISSLPSILHLGRKPIVFCALMAGFVLFSGYLMYRFEEADFRHLEAVADSKRLLHTQEVLDEVKKRPWLGLFHSADSIAHGNELNSHNSYVEMLYLGGLATAIPLWVTAIVSAIGAWTSIRRKMFGALQTHTAAFLYLVTLGCGFFTYITFYPTYLFTFAAAVFGQLFLIEFELPLRPSIDTTRVHGHSRRIRRRAGPLPRAIVTLSRF